jgi:hypothetical protein
MGPLWAKAVDYLMENFHALRDAPLVFLAVLALALGGAYWISNVRYQGALDQKNSTIETLKTQLDGLQQRVKDLQAQAANVQAPATASRDPDGIYQLGGRVGTVENAQVDRANGRVMFGAIKGALNLNTSADFEYREYTLRFIGAAATTSMGGLAMTPNRAFMGVTSKIVAIKQ